MLAGNKRPIHKAAKANGDDANGVGAAERGFAGAFIVSPLLLFALTKLSDALDANNGVSY
jgi:hypothetical protein